MSISPTLAVAFELLDRVMKDIKNILDEPKRLATELAYLKNTPYGSYGQKYVEAAPIDDSWPETLFSTSFLSMDIRPSTAVQREHICPSCNNAVYSMMATSVKRYVQFCPSCIGPASIVDVAVAVEAVEAVAVAKEAVEAVAVAVAVEAVATTPIEHLFVPKEHIEKGTVAIVSSKGRSFPYCCA